MIANWRYIDPTLVTQRIPGQEQQAANELELFAEHYEIDTPRENAPVNNHTVHAPPPPQPARATQGAEPPIEMPNLYHIQTRLADGRPALIIDPGSVGNLCGDKWARELATAAARNGHHPSYEKRGRPLRVSGVGSGSQMCEFDCKLPVALRTLNGNATSIGLLTTPTVLGSDLPGLLGLNALRKNRAVLDFQTLTLHFCGPGDHDLGRGLPPGTDSFQLEIAPSGHLVLPCCEYVNGTTTNDHTLTLVSQEAANRAHLAGQTPRVVPPPQRRATTVTPVPTTTPLANPSAQRPVSTPPRRGPSL